MGTIIGSVVFWLAVTLGLGALFVSFWFRFRLEKLRSRDLPPARRENYPPTTVIMPLKGIDPGLEDNLIAVLEQVAFPQFGGHLSYAASAADRAA